MTHIVSYSNLSFHHLFDINSLRRKNSSLNFLWGFHPQTQNFWLVSSFNMVALIKQENNCPSLTISCKSSERNKCINLHIVLNICAKSDKTCFSYLLFEPGQPCLVDHIVLIWEIDLLFMELIHFNQAFCR